MGKPVLDTIRAILKFKKHTTIAEIASIGEMRKRDVLDVVNANLALLGRNTENGRIFRVNTETPLKKQLWESGDYYRIEDYGAWSKEGEQITFHGHDDLRDTLSEGRRIGALGDSYQATIIKYSPSNIAAVEAAGLKPWADVVIDDRLWKEG